MNQLWLVIICIGVLVFMSFLSSRNLKKKIIFFGDSITQAGTSSHGYITVLQDILEHENINNYELIGSGVSGNKVRDLYLRIDEDVLKRSPDIVFVYIGINDAWNGSSGTVTDLENFTKLYRAIIDKLRSSHAKVVLCTTSVIGEKNDFSNEVNIELDKYCDIIRNLASELRLLLVDLRKAFIEYELRNNKSNYDSGILTIDGIHLNDRGNELVAKLIWDAIKKLK